MKFLRYILLITALVGVTPVKAMQPLGQAGANHEQEEVSVGSEVATEVVQQAAPATCEMATQTDPLPEVLMRDAMDMATQELHRRLNQSLIALVARAPEQFAQAAGLYQTALGLLPRMQEAMNSRAGLLGLMSLIPEITQLVQRAGPILETLRPILAEQSEGIGNHMVRFVTDMRDSAVRLAQETRPELVETMQQLYATLLVCFNTPQ